MTNSTADRLVDDYLTRLAGASQALPPDRRTELLAEIRGHIAASLSGATDADEAAVRTMLDRLGDPADIVAAAVENDPPEPPSVPGTQGRRPGISLEVGAVVMLTAGSLVPVIGWVVGVILLWSSGVWRRSEKLLGTLIVPGGPAWLCLLPRSRDNPAPALRARQSVVRSPLRGRSARASRYRRRWGLRSCSSS
jgi:hypothetical protein